MYPNSPALDAAFNKFRHEETINQSLLSLARESRNSSPARHGANSVEIQPNAYLMHAVNHFSRLHFGRIALDEVFNHFNVREDNQPTEQAILFGTVCDAALTLPDDEPAVSLKVSKARIVQAIGADCSYFGMIEPGYYTNITEDAFPRTRLISWHAHLLIWGIDRKRMQQRFSWLSGKRKGPELPYRMFEGVRPGLRPLDLDAIKPGQLERVLRYILKSPREQYSLWKRRKASERLGYIVWEQRPRPLQGGNRLKLFELMKTDLFLDQMAVAGGDGEAILSRIKNRALAELRRRQRAERDRHNPHQRT